jgi:streptogramin lyase
LTLLASAVVPNVTHIDELAPDPSGGVWFADDEGNTTVHPSIFGKMSAAGAISTYPQPSNLRASAVATALDGSVWVSLSDTSTGASLLGHVSESGKITTYPVPVGQAEYLRGTYGRANCDTNALYWLDGGDNVMAINLR